MILFYGAVAFCFVRMIHQSEKSERLIYFLFCALALLSQPEDGVVVVFGNIGSHLGGVLPLARCTEAMLLSD